MGVLRFIVGFQGLLERPLDRDLQFVRMHTLGNISVLRNRNALPMTVTELRRIPDRVAHLRLMKVGCKKLECSRSRKAGDSQRAPRERNEEMV